MLKISSFLFHFRMNNHISNLFQMTIIQTCIKYADKLYEKYSVSVNRKTQSDAWDSVVKELTTEGIKVPNVPKLKQNVSNWIRRATVSLFLYSYKLTLVK